MIDKLIERLQRVARTNPDPKIRKAAKRDAAGYARALERKRARKAS